MYSELKNQFDPLDLEILEALMLNARIPFAQLAQQLKVSNSLVHQRVRKMREAGVIEDPVFQVDPGKLGYETAAYIQIMVESAANVPIIIQELEKIPEIVECSNVAGQYDIMVKVYTINNQHLRDLLYERVQSIEGVEGTNTVISFETAFSRGVPLKLR